MSSGKILATIVGISTIVVLISQLTSSNDLVVEPYNVGGPMIRSLVDTQEYVNDPRGGRAKSNLLSHLPDSVFFGNAQFEKDPVISEAAGGSANVGARLQYAMNNGGSAPQGVFESFEQAARVVEPYIQGVSVAGPTNKPTRTHLRKCPSGCVSSPAGCGPEGTIFDDYAPNLLGSNFQALNTTKLPVAGYETSELPVGEFNVMNQDGTLSSRFFTERLVYSTAKRARCPGTADLIRGDLAITPCAIAMRPAARPGDTLETGAFAAMNGAFGNTPQEVAALVANDTSLGAYATHGGANLAELVLTEDSAPVLSAATFTESSGANLLNNLRASGMESSVGADTVTGQVQVMGGLTSYP